MLFDLFFLLTLASPEVVEEEEEDDDEPNPNPGEAGLGLLEGPDSWAGSVLGVFWDLMRSVVNLDLGVERRK